VAGDKEATVTEQITTVKERARLVRLMVENLSQLPLQDRLAVALNLIITLAKESSLPRYLFLKITEAGWDNWDK
jgi:hypothetical protein